MRSLGKLFGRRPSGDEDVRRDNERVRAPHAAPIEVQIMGAHSLDIVNARDISMTGLGVYVPHGFEGDTVDVELVITLPGERPFLARGLVKHVTDIAGGDAHFGVEFRDLKRDDRRRIRDYIDRLRAA